MNERINEIAYFSVSWETRKLA